MNALALTPLKDHPDARIFKLVAARDEERDAFEACTNNQQRRAHMRERIAEYDRWQAETIDLNARQAITLEGLIAKAEHCLREWRGDTEPERYFRFWGGLAMCLEQAIATLQAAPAPPPVVRVIPPEEPHPRIRRRGSKRS